MEKIVSITEPKEYINIKVLLAAALFFSVFLIVAYLTEILLIQNNIISKGDIFHVIIIISAIIISFILLGRFADFLNRIFIKKSDVRKIELISKLND